MTQCRTRVRIYRPKNETKMAKHASISTATPILSQEFSLGVGSLQCSLQTLTGGVRAWTITSSFPMVAVKHGATVISVNIGRSVITHAHMHTCIQFHADPVDSTTIMFTHTSPGIIVAYAEAARTMAVFDCSHPGMILSRLLID